MGAPGSWPLRSLACPPTDAGDYFRLEWTPRIVDTWAQQEVNLVCVCACARACAWWGLLRSFEQVVWSIFQRSIYYFLMCTWHIATWKTVLTENNNFPHLSDNRRVTIKNEKKQINMLPSWLDHLISNVLLVWGRQSLPCDEHTPCLGMQCEWVEGAVKTPPHSQAFAFYFSVEWVTNWSKLGFLRIRESSSTFQKDLAFIFHWGVGREYSVFGCSGMHNQNSVLYILTVRNSFQQPFPLRSAANTQGWNFPSLG